MIIFKENQKIAFNGINIELFEAGIGYDLGEKKIEQLNAFNIDYVIAEDEQLGLSDAEKENSINLAAILTAEENIEAANAVLEEKKLTAEELEAKELAELDALTRPDAE